MLNEKTILLYGFRRGGTNITWNIMQSHPYISSPIYETKELFYRSKRLKIIYKLNHYWSGKRIVDKELFKFKMDNLNHVDNRYSSEGELYTKGQLKNCALCMKSVNEQMIYTDVILKTYPDLYFIALTRNGYALAEGYIRRGMSASDAGKIYNRIYEEIKRLSNIISKYKLIKFEDVVEDPFGISKELFQFVDVNPKALKKLRFKSKKVVSEQGKHKIRFGEEHRKYWVDEDNVSNIIDKKIGEKQIRLLSSKDIKSFNREAKSALLYFGYDIL